LLAGDDITPNEQTTVYMAAHGCHFVVCSLCVLIVIIEIVSFAARTHAAQAVLYKPGPVVVSRVFLEERSRHIDWRTMSNNCRTQPGAATEGRPYSCCASCASADVA